MKYIKKITKLLIGFFIKPLFYIKYNFFRQRNVHKIITKKHNSFFGYYNKCPWNMSQTKIITLRVDSAHSEPDNISEASLILIDLNTKEETIISTTRCWNTQQGCMAQWMGPDFESNIIFNDFENNKYVSKIYNLEKNEVIKTFDMPIYDVASNGTFALTLDFSRLHKARPGYGYRNVASINDNNPCPDDYCIWKIDFKTGNIVPIIKYSTLFNFNFRDDMKNAYHKVNHIVINPSNTRFMFLHRWIFNGKKISRLITCDISGNNMYNLSDDNMVSHCCWKNDSEILGFLRKNKYGDHYYILQDQTEKYKMIWKKIREDGHCTYDYSKELILSDTYPNVFGISKVYVGSELDEEPKVIAEFFSPNKYKNDLRCDLHPRWNYDGSQICVDAVTDGYKKIYLIDYRRK